MKVIVRHKHSGNKVDYVQGRKPQAEGRGLIFTDKRAEARNWNTLYAATDFICKSNTKLEGVEIIQIDNKPEDKKTPSGKTHKARAKSKQKAENN